MTFALFNALLGWVGVILGYVMTWMQFQRARDVGVEGISLQTWSLFLFMGFFWVSYGIGSGDWVILAGSGPLLPLQIALVARLKPIRNRRVVVLSGGFVFLLSFVTSFIGGWDMGVLGTTVAMLWTRMPQIIELVKDPDVEGVSISSWVIGAVCSAFWVAYYVGVHKWWAMAATAVAVLSNLVIAGLASWRQRARENATL